MKRIAIFLLIAILCVGIGWGAYSGTNPAEPPSPLSKFVPAGPLLYLEAKDFSALLADWNSSAQKKQWTQSSNFEVFSRSRLFMRILGPPRGHRLFRGHVHRRQDPPLMDPLRCALARCQRHG